MAVHADLDLSTISFVDSGKKFVSAKSGSLIATYSKKHWQFVTTIGQKYETIAVQMRRVDYTNALTFSGSVRYDPNTHISLIVSVGQDVGASASVLKGVDIQHFLRADLILHLL